MKRTVTLSVRSEGMTVREFLREKGFSRHLLIQLKQRGGSILVDGKESRMNERVSCGQSVTVCHEDAEPSPNIVPVRLPLQIVYEDEDVIVLNKPTDMPVHPSMGNYDNTLANALVFYYKEQEEPFVFRCINRLDRDTTGLVAVAKNAISGAMLSEQMKNRQIHRTYRAVVRGKTPPRGSIAAPIARITESLIERGVDFARGERAVTHYKTLCYEDGYSLVELQLETGRTHQIRVHMKYISHPLPGDFLYCPEFDKVQRHLLHSAALSFVHPLTGCAMHFSADLPSEFKSLFPRAIKEPAASRRTCQK